MGIFAVMLAISFSAFTVPGSTRSAKNLTVLHWYYFDNGSGFLDGEISSSTISHDDAEEATGCFDTENSTIDCARGYLLPQDPYDETPAAGDDQVKKVDTK